MTPEQAGTAAAAAARVAGKALEDTKEEPSLHHGSALQDAERCDEIVAAGAEFCCCQCSGSCSRSSGRGWPGHARCNLTEKVRWSFCCTELFWSSARAPRVLRLNSKPLQLQRLQGPQLLLLREVQRSLGPIRQERFPIKSHSYSRSQNVVV